MESMAGESPIALVNVINHPLDWGEVTLGKLLEMWGFISEHQFRWLKINGMIDKNIYIYILYRDIVLNPDIHMVDIGISPGYSILSITRTKKNTLYFNLAIPWFFPSVISLSYGKLFIYRRYAPYYDFVGIMHKKPGIILPSHRFGSWDGYIVESQCPWNINDILMIVGMCIYIYIYTSHIYIYIPCAPCMEYLPTFAQLKSPIYVQTYNSIK